MMTILLVILLFFALPYIIWTLAVARVIIKGTAIIAKDKILGPPADEKKQDG